LVSSKIFEFRQRRRLNRYPGDSDQRTLIGETERNAMMRMILSLLNPGSDFSDVTEVNEGLPSRKAPAARRKDRADAWLCAAASIDTDGKRGYHLTARPKIMLKDYIFRRPSGEVIMMRSPIGSAVMLILTLLLLAGGVESAAALNCRGFRHDCSRWCNEWTETWKDYHACIAGCDAAYGICKAINAAAAALSIAPAPPPPPKGPKGLTTPGILENAPEPSPTGPAGTGSPRPTAPAGPTIR
jgi:hypothetical protein